MKKQRINVVFNYSSETLTNDMESVLNKGLNFSPIPEKLDITQLFVDFQRFERTMIWQEFWYGRDESEYQEPSIFKSVKNNLPRNYKSPRGLEICLGAIKSELTDPKNRNKVPYNLPKEEKLALKQLTGLQKEKKIVIKPADKGAGIVIVNFDDYIETCVNHLSSSQTSSQGEEAQFYQKVDNKDIDNAKLHITKVIQEGFNNEILNKNEYKEMLPENRGVGRFYCTFKVHKDKGDGCLPPERPIVSCNNSFTENIGLFVDHHIKDLATNHETYLQDTPHFLRSIEDINSNMNLPTNAILVTMDVSSLYTVIPQDEGVECMREAYSESHSPSIPPEFLSRLMELVLKCNIFEFNGEFYKQVIGTAMGSKPAPSYANIFMSRKIDTKIFNIAKYFSEYEGLNLLFFKRFLDDLFMIFTGSTQKLHSFFHQVNKIHPNIKLTMSHTSVPGENALKCDCEEKYSISFLDTSCRIKSGKIVTDLYRKPSDRNQYLLTSSCHPVECTENIPYSLCLRINRICSEPEDRELRFNELKQLLLDRGYTLGVINSAIDRARSIPRKDILKKVVRQNSERRPIFKVTFDPRYPSIPSVTRKHWRSMVSQDPYLSEVFPKPPMTAYKRQKNIKDILIRSKINSRGKINKRTVKGMKTCGKQCSICPFIHEKKKISFNNFTWNINQKLDCNTSNIIYIIECTKDNCKSIYIGESERPLRKRTLEHKGYIQNHMLDKATGEHFNMPGHDINCMKVSIIEKVRKLCVQYRKEREKYFIRKFNSYYKGMNKQP